MDELVEVVEPALTQAVIDLKLALRTLEKLGAHPDALADLRVAISRARRVRERIPASVA